LKSHEVRLLQRICDTALDGEALAEATAQERRLWHHALAAAKALDAVVSAAQAAPLLPLAADEHPLLAADRRSQQLPDGAGPAEELGEELVPALWHGRVIARRIDAGGSHVHWLGRHLQLRRPLGLDVSRRLGRAELLRLEAHVRAGHGFGGLVARAARRVCESVMGSLEPRSS